MHKNILILGGTSDASALANALHGKVKFTLSLAGRTQKPSQPVAFRSGGFGGIDGLAAYLESRCISHVVDATHPFARQMSANAAAACARTGTPLIQLSRPAWRAEPGDIWREFETIDDIVAALDLAPKRVFLTHGRLQLDAFARAAQHFYLIRTIDPPQGLQNLNHRLILERGPFSEADEMALMQAEKIDILVTKNSGGSATYGKIRAARALKIPVFLLHRPLPENCPQAETVDDVLRWLHALMP